MFRVGLTGNVAAGKSTVLELFRRWGAATIDADELARLAVEPGSPALGDIARRFGAGVLATDGSLDRAALRRLVMRDRTLREALNDIVHPVVARLATQRETEARRAGAEILVHDVPLLFEALDPSSFDAVVLVDAPAAMRRERLVADRGLPADEADDLIAAQAESQGKRRQSTWVIDNDGSRDALWRRARDVWTELQRRAGVV